MAYRETIGEFNSNNTVILGARHILIEIRVFEAAAGCAPGAC
jgi:hypothetical protein